jgi:GTP cyclohydrolase I
MLRAVLPAQSAGATGPGAACRRRRRADDPAMAASDPIAPGADAARRVTDRAHSGRSTIGSTLDRVGMTGIEVPVRLRDPSGAALLAAARADAFVSLDDPAARGIHMSRLYLALQAMHAEEDLGFAALERVLQSFLGSHRALSASAWVRIAFDHLVKRPALITATAGWRAYPVSIGASSVRGVARHTLGAEILYSSSCPCSTALSQQLTQERFLRDFAGRGHLAAADVAAWLGSSDSLAAVPHSQRSRARIEVAVAHPQSEAQRAPGFVELIDLAESALGTPVQAAVKREDEQEFARRNAAGPMFCEDAGRRLKSALDGDARFADWRIEVAHLESLHPHDAVAIAAKGVSGGFVA